MDELIATDEDVNCRLLCVTVYGCKNLDGMLEHAVVRRHGDTTSVRCLATGETFFLTCIESRWVGELNNCSAPSRGSSASTVLSKLSICRSCELGRGYRSYFLVKHDGNRDDYLLIYLFNMKIVHKYTV